METRASYILVGVFVLAFFLAGVAAVVWLADVNLDEDVVKYDIFFEGSVSGLRTGNPVRYRGIPVGVVSDMRINPDNVEEVQVTIEVPRTTPIKEDATASLEFQGITGVAYVQISGGTHDAPALKPPPGRTRPVIPSMQSQIQEVMDQAPELLSRFIGLVDQAREIMNDENRQRLSETLTNLSGFTGALANSSGDIEQALSETAATLAQVRATAAEAETVLASFADHSDAIATSLDETLAQANRLTGEAAALVEAARPLVDETTRTVGTVGRIADAVEPHAGPIAAETEGALRDIRTVTQELEGATDDIARAADQAATLMEEARGPVGAFTSTGLYEFTQLVVEMRVLVASLSRITTEIERDPARFFFGDKTEGFEAQ
ncbi:MAG: MCE family protein [Alphaproteobacteria bacterium]|nr:MCE family protein [Alphaproteobacteria bacterium]